MRTLAQVLLVLHETFNLAHGLLETRNLYFLKEVHLLGGLLAGMLQQPQFGKDEFAFHGSLYKAMEQVDAVEIPLGSTEDAKRFLRGAYIGIKDFKVEKICEI